ncbi:type II toxin-antitoxin system HicB family antitoxin [Candidatus Gottesmanbacteria bacterium]|nr:type II toxin-antitoxin system HicB family antitoxin [Candidatus Gottesmanbacteria bacterium]
MQTTVLNYRIIVEPDERTGTNEPCFTAYCPTLGVADGGDTIEEALANVRGAIEAYVESLVEDGLLVPVDKPEESIIAATQVKVHGAIQFA